MVQAPSACADFTISIYFEPRSAVVTRDAAELIRAAAVRAQDCTVGGVDVLGLSEVEGDPDATLALSKARAIAVTRALSRRGFRIVQFQVGAVGDPGAMAGPGRSQPLHRRADVTFHLTPKPPKASRA
jgi:outer membrane protein OmpA-like peptidoglycan-associated protein